jgi:hypothetical protein
MSLKRVGFTLALAVTACGGIVSRSDSVRGSAPEPAEPGSPGVSVSSSFSTSAGWGSGTASTGSGPGFYCAAACSGSFVGSGSVASAQSYSQNANQALADDAGTFPWITCYGTVDGSSCLISDINGGSTLGNGVHSVDCSAATGICACTVMSTGLPTSNSGNPATVATFPFTQGTCPTGSTTQPYPSSTLGSVAASACSASAAPLFARCGW